MSLSAEERKEEMRKRRDKLDAEMHKEKEEKIKAAHDALMAKWEPGKKKNQSFY